MNTREKIKSMKTQQGIATLAVTMIILIIVTLTALGVGKSALTEQKVAGTDARSKEVYSAAISGLDYAVNWLDVGGGLDCPFKDGSGNCKTTVTVGDTGSPDALSNTALSADSYTHTLTYTAKTTVGTTPGVDDDGTPMIIEVTSTATAVNDSHITKTIRVDVLRASILQGGGIFDGPPLLIEGTTCSVADPECCMDGITGTPNSVPIVTGGTAVGLTMGITDCVAAGHLSVTDSNPGVPINPDTQVVDRASDPQTLWQTVWGETTEAQIMALANADPNDHFHYVTSSNPWNTNVGTADTPGILYFDSAAGCPAINGGPIIYGIVYFESDCSGNDHNGWGNATVYGTVAITGNMDKLTANGTIYDVDLDDEGLGGGNSIYATAAVIPGTWRDF